MQVPPLRDHLEISNDAQRQARSCKADKDLALTTPPSFIPPCSHAVPHNPKTQGASSQGYGTKAAAGPISRDKTKPAAHGGILLAFQRYVVARLVETRRHRFQKPVFPPPPACTHEVRSVRACPLSSERARGRGWEAFVSFSSFSFPINSSPAFPNGRRLQCV